MKTRLLAIMLCAAMLMSAFAIGIGAESAAATADGLFYTVSYGTTDGKTMSELTALSADQAAVYSDGRSFTLNSSTGLPCQIFEVDTSGVTTDSITLSVGAGTIEHERVALKAFNVTTNKWDTLTTVVSAGDLRALVPLNTYSADGKLKAMVTLDYVANGSNRFIWRTDQQHYTKHDDLNDFYFKIHEYMIAEYQNDNVAYVINTGDIVDDTPNLKDSPKQWKLASDAFALLDEAGVPYGIETGNHDVGDFPANNYIHYLNYFGKDRYEGKPWYGDSIDDNKCHYDLVTVGNYDFLILYIGYGQGSDDAVLNWANEVLAKYPHRNAILCTHQYLKPADLSQAGRAEILHNTVVSKNPNVKMVLSGHYKGTGYKWRDAEGRQVLEVVADYQFVQAESEEYYAGHKDPLHHIGSSPYCNGEGYIREVIVNGNTIDMYAFSPVTGGVTPYGSTDDLRFTVELQANERTLTTFDFTASTENAAGIAQNPEEGLNIVCDAPAMKALIAKASEADKSLYTKDSYKTMKAALKAAKKAVKAGGALQAEYVALNTAYGALEEPTFKMDREKLETVHDLNLQLPMWENLSGPKSLDKARSHINAEQLDNGGFTAIKSNFATNDWPAMKYITPITFTPKDGKVYLYLDIDAGCTWSLFPRVIQDMNQYEGRLNSVIQGSFDNTLDAGSGIYKGVYDVTEALVNMGVDPTKEMTITFIMNVVPGPATFNEISILTGEYKDGFMLDLGGNTLWILVGVVILLGGAAVIFAVLYTPKKKEETEVTETNADKTEETE